MSKLTKKQLIDKNGIHTTRNVKDEVPTGSPRLRNVAPSVSTRPITDVRSGDEIALENFRSALGVKTGDLRNAMTVTKDVNHLAELSSELQSTMIAHGNFEHMLAERGSIREARDEFITTIAPMINKGDAEDPLIKGLVNVLVPVRKIEYTNNIIDLQPSKEESAWFPDDPDNTFNRFENHLTDLSLEYAKIYANVAYRDDDDEEKSAVVEKMDNLDRYRRTWAHIVNESASLFESKNALVDILGEEIKKDDSNDAAFKILNSINILESNRTW